MKTIFNKKQQPFIITHATSSIPEYFQQELLEISSFDGLIQQNTTDRKRFFTRKQLESWLKINEREFYFLSPKNNPKQLSGIVWFTKKVLPKFKQTVFSEKYPNKPQPHWTLAIRIYKNDRGTGLGLPFLTESFHHFEKKHPHQAVWLTCLLQNSPALKIYKNFGFKMFWQNEVRTTGVAFTK